MSDDIDSKRLDRQGRQQGLIVEQLQRALLRISEAENDIAKIHGRLDEHDDAFNRQADRLDVYGEILQRLEAARAGIASELEAAANGGKDDGAGS